MLHVNVIRMDSNENPFVMINSFHHHHHSINVQMNEGFFLLVKDGREKFVTIETTQTVYFWY